MVNDPGQEKLLFFQKAMADIKSENDEVRLKGIRVLGDTIGYLSTNDIEYGAMIILEQILVNKTESQVVKDTVLEALQAIKERCEHNDTKRDIAIKATTTLQGFSKKKTNRTCLYIALGFAALFIIVMCIAMSFDFARFMSQ